jgi:hypothetical protein
MEATAMSSAATTLAISILETFIRQAADQPHCAVDSLLQIAQRTELEQDGRLTDLQVSGFGFSVRLFASTAIWGSAP